MSFKNCTIDGVSYGDDRSLNIDSFPDVSNVDWY